MTAIITVTGGLVGSLGTLLSSTKIMPPSGDTTTSTTITTTPKPPEPTPPVGPQEVKVVNTDKDRVPVEEAPKTP